MPGTFWPFMFTGILWIKMPACGFRGAGFAIFGGWLAASFGMNMEAMFTGGVMLSGRAKTPDLYRFQ